MEKFYVDIHFDLMLFVERRRSSGHRNVIVEHFLDDIREGGFRLIVSSIYIDDEYIPEMALRKALDQISALYQEIEESEGRLCLCKNGADIEALKDNDKIGIMLAFEGVEPLYNDINLLDIFYELGVRIVGLNWSRRNYAADGSFFSPKREGKKGGLTPFGVELVERAENKGMLIDVSHLNDEGFNDVFEFTDGPVIATHSNSRAIVPVMRNLKDEQIKKLGRRGGLIGINSANKFTSNEDATSNVPAYVDHIDRIADLIGIEHVALGFDLCDTELTEDTKKELTIGGRDFFNVVKGHRGTADIRGEMERRGYSAEQIRQVFGENFIHLIKKQKKKNHG